MKRFTAPQMHSLEMYNHLSLGAISHITEKSREYLTKLLDTIKRIKPTKDNDIWSFWVNVPRGSIDDFGDYKELHEMGEYSTHEEFERSWKEWYPKDTYWYEIAIVSRNGYAAIIVNNSTVINIDPIESTVGYEDYEVFLQFLIDEVAAIINSLQEGTYNQQIKDALPVEYKTGIISRHLLKYLSPKTAELAWRGLTFDEVVHFVKNSMDEQMLEYRDHPEKVKNEQERAHFKTLYEMLKSGDCIERVPSLTANYYYEACAVCYQFAEYSKQDGLTPKEQYCLHADDRDGGLRDINSESSAAFDEWFSGKMQPKNDYVNASHKWEVIAGSTHTRIHLTVCKDEKGYYMVLSGGLYTSTTEVVRMYNALKEKGFPIFLFNHMAIRNRLLFLDEVGIVPINKSAHQFWYGGFPKKGIITYAQLSELELTNEESSRVTEAIKWFDVPQLSLIGE